MSTDAKPRMLAVVALARRYGVRTISLQGARRVDEAPILRARGIDVSDKARSEGPSAASLYWPGGPIVVSAFAMERGNEEDAAYVLHELGHLIVGGDPNGHDEEFGPGLAIDHALFEAVGSPWWEKFMSTFPVNDGHWIEWSDLSIHKRQERIRVSRTVAIRAGLLTTSGDLAYRLGGSHAS